MVYITNLLFRPLFRFPIPCCSTSILSNGGLRFLSFSNPHLQNKDPDERPHMFQLEHVQNRLAETVPMMFYNRLDYTFYRKDVVLEDKIIDTRKEGLESLIYYWGMVAVAGKFLFPFIRMEPLNILPILEDGTVRLRWRIHYLTWLSIFDFRTYNKEYRMKNSNWYDGYSIFHVDGNGLVYHIIMQRTMPDDPRVMKQPNKIVEKLGQKLAENTSTASYASEESVEKNSESFKKN